DNKRITLPIIDNNGQPDKYIYGFNWVKWTWRVNSPKKLNIDDFNKGVRDFCLFWIHKNDYQNKDIKFIISEKKIDIPKKWEHDFLNIQIQKPWTEVYEAFWVQKKFKLPIINND